MEEKKVKGKKNWLLLLFALIVAIILMFPVYWIVVTSIKTEQEIFLNPPTLFPQILNTETYKAQLSSGDFNMFASFKNSFLISISAMVISVVLAVPGSYGIARYRFKGKTFLLLFFLMSQMLPVSVLLTPMFVMFSKIGLINNPLSVILADATIGIPFSILILQTFFASIPKELEESAKIDGCNNFGAFLRIVVPVASTGIVVCAIFSFLYAWGDLAYGMTFIREQTLRPITAGIFNFMGQHGTKWSYITAFAVVTIIPVVIIFVFCQKYIISGMTSGAVKE